MSQKDSFGSRMAEERARLDLSQALIATKVDVSREQWGKYERDVNLPGGEVLIQLAELGADVTYIISGRRQMPTTELNVSLLRTVIESVEGFLKRERLSLQVEKKADLMALMYQQALPAGSLSAETTKQFFRLVA